MAGDYIYDQAWQEERERLRGMERLWDGGTFALLERLGVGPGASFADVGAGGGSVVEWAASRVGPQGRVLAADIFTKYIEPLAGETVEVLETDIRATPLPEGQFDVVHARLLVEHVGTDVLPNLVAGLKPGGTLLVEDYDFGLRGWDPPDAVAERVVDGLIGLMSAMGFDPYCGRRLPAALEAAGLSDVDTDSRARVVRSGTPDTAFFHLTLESLRDALVANGVGTAEEIDGLRAKLREPGDMVALSPLMVAAWGTRPG